MSSQNPYARDPHQPAYQAEPMSPEQERTWATLTHVGVGAATVLSAGTLGFFAALAVYLFYKDRGPFVRHNAANAMNIQLNALLWVVLIAIFGVLTLSLGWALFFAVPVVMVVLHVLAAMKANDGQWYNPPFTLRFIR